MLQQGLRWSAGTWKDMHEGSLGHAHHHSLALDSYSAPPLGNYSRTQMFWKEHNDT